MFVFLLTTGLVCRSVTVSRQFYEVVVAIGLLLAGIARFFFLATVL